MRYLVVFIFSAFTLFTSSVLAIDIVLSSEMNRMEKEDNKARLQFTAQESAWIEANRSVTVIGDARWFPFEGFDDSGRYVGIVAEVLNLITLKSGLIFDVKETASWRHSLQFSEDKQVDIISASASNPIIEKNYRPTYSTIKSPIVMIASNDTRYISDLSAAEGLRVALIGTAGYNKKIIDTYPSINFINIDEIEEGLLGVAEERYDLVLMSMMVASHQMAELGLYELRVAGITDFDMELTLFVNRNKPILWSIIDKVKRNENQQEHHKILSKWATNDVVSHYSPGMVRSFIVIAILLMCFSYRYYWLRKQAKRLLALARIDKLTNSYNRVYLDELFTKKIAQSVRKKNEFSVIMVDLDGLRAVNDKYGYRTGDKLIQQFVLLLQEHISEHDVVGRWAGGELVIICSNTNCQQALVLAEKLRVETAQTIFLGIGKKTASFGVVQYQSPESAEGFLGRADKALYEAKASGRNQVKAAL